MKALRAISIPTFVLALAFVASPAAAGQEGSATADARTDAVSSLRSDFNKILDHYDGVFRKLEHARGLRLIAAAREKVRAISDDELAKLFRSPDISAAVQAAARLESLTPSRGSKTPRTDTPGFPNAPPILSQCDDIAHSPGFTFGSLVAWQVLRAIFVGAEFGCLQTAVVLGEGGNFAFLCVIPAILQDAAGIPFELASFCSGEEDTALAQGSYDRLEHLHNDIEAARAQIIMEMRNLSCDIERLLHTPEGQKKSSIAECKGQPYWPYDFPINP